MKVALLLLIAAVLSIAQVSDVTSLNAPISASNPGWLLVTFQNPLGSGSAQGTASVYESYNAASFFEPAGKAMNYACRANVRDPSAIRYGGNYLLAHTLTGSGSCITDTHHIGFASSTDGFTYGSEMQFNCPLSGFCWAPEWFADPEHCIYDHTNGWTCSAAANLHIYFANSTNTLCCSSFTLYEMHPTASDFISNPASWSTPVALTFSSGSFVPIDPFMVCMNSVTGNQCSNPAVANDTYYMWFNSKSSSTGCINYGSMPSTTGAITPILTSDCFGFGTYVEGPAVICVNNCTSGTSEWRVYVDDYNNTYDQGQWSYATSTNVWVSFSAFQTFIVTPTQAKQGAIISYP